MRLRVKKIGINGEGIAYLKKKPVFITNALVDEEVEVEIKEDNGTYLIGEVKKYITTSKERVEPICHYFNKCGGCNLMMTNYQQQLKIKKELVQEALYRYAGYKGKIEDTVASDKDLYYRNKCNLPFLDNKGKLDNGLYQSGSNIFQTVDKCVLHSNKLEKLRKEILEVLNSNGCKLYDKKTKYGFRQLVIRGFVDNYQVVLITGKDKLSDKLIEDLSKCKGLTSLYQGVNIQKDPYKLMPEELTLLYGSKEIPFNLGKYQLQLTPQAFFQLNQYTALNLYNKLNELIKKPVNTIVEAYCGIGAISLFLHDKAEKVIGIDIEPTAIKDSKYNAKLNNITNCSFKVGDAASQVRSLIKKEDIDILVVDPPRKGIDDSLLETLCHSNINEIIYISCNPATLAKNVDVLQKKYRLVEVHPFDMFPQTALVETIAVLKLKKDNKK